MPEPQNGLVEADGGIFSHMLFKDPCTGEKIQQYLEPLASSLRSPFFHCFRNEIPTHCAKHSSSCDRYSVFSLDFLSFPEIDMVNRLAPSEKRIFFDLGTFNFSSGINGYAPSLKWFMDTYRARGLEFDLIVSWEAQPVNHNEFWRHVPDEYVMRLVYYNFPSSSVPGSPRNVVTQLKARCQKEDYCVLKLDIDDTEVEESIIEQILADRSASELLDELFWEHHVHENPLSRSSWGNDALSRTASTVKDSYQLFTRLRKLGIRAHSWV